MPALLRVPTNGVSFALAHTVRGRRRSAAVGDSDAMTVTKARRGP